MYDYWLEGGYDRYYRAWRAVHLLQQGKILRVDQECKEYLETVNLLFESIRHAKPPLYKKAPIELSLLQWGLSKKRGKEHRYTYEVYPEMKEEIDNLLTIHAFGKLGDLDRAAKYFECLYYKAMDHWDKNSRRRMA